MGKPAARMGDTTVHGGTITLGCPTVLIGGAPAARMGDMHVCPMATPGTPPIPHVGGPILLGSTGVFIGGAPAARMGDMVTCVGPPDTILMGCMTVLIGETGAGGGGGSSGAGNSSGEGGSVSASYVAKISAAIATAGNNPEDPVNSDDLAITVMDKGNFLISGVYYTLKKPDNTSMCNGFLSGHIRYNGVEKGVYTLELCTVSKCKWSAASANVGDTVNIDVTLTGVEAGTPAVVNVYRHKSGKSDRLVKVFETSVTGDTISIPWKCSPDQEENTAGNLPEKTCAPFYYFIVLLDKISERSGMLQIYDTIELCCVDENEKPYKNAKYEMTMENGQVVKGSLDGNGKANVKNVFPGKISTRIIL